MDEFEVARNHTDGDMQTIKKWLDNEWPTLVKDFQAVCNDNSSERVGRIGIDEANLILCKYGGKKDVALKYFFAKRQEQVSLEVIIWNNFLLKGF